LTIKPVIALLLGGLAAAQPSSPSTDLYRQFVHPPRADSLMPYWYWNGRINPADTRRQIQAMIDQGVYQAVVFPWDGMEQRYLSEDYWHQFGTALAIAKELNFTLNFADEYDWPSGHAWDVNAGKPELSRVLIGHPEYRMMRLKYTETIIEGPAAAPPRPEHAIFTVAGRMNSSDQPDSATFQIVDAGWTAPAGRWLVTSYELVPATGGHNTRVDLLNPDAVDTYLELVYGEYARRFSQYFGNTLRLTLADHEGSYGAPIAYTPRLWETFRQRHGYDLRPVLPLLVRDSSGDRRAQEVRRDYLDTIAHLYVASFTGKVAEWCRKHNIQHATSAYEEQMFIQVGHAGDMFQHWRAGSAVEIDALLERSRMPIDFKEAVSVAHFDRKPLLVENQGLQGHSTFFSLQKARLGVNMSILWGADRLIPYFDYDQQKVTWPPQWFIGQPFWRYFRHFASYVNRAQFMNGQGSHIAPVAIYYPLETAFANSSQLFTQKPHRDLFWNSFTDQTENVYTALRLEMARQGWDYHILDAHYLKAASIRDRELELSGERFRVLILPPMTDLAESSIAKIRNFVKAGGTVLAIGAQPAGLDGVAMQRFAAATKPPFTDHLDYLEQIEVPSAIRRDLEPVLKRLAEVQPPEAEVIGDKEHIFFSHRRRGDFDWYWVVNDSPESRDIRMRFPQGGTLEKWDAETGDRSPLGSDGPSVRLHLDAWDAFFVVRSPGSPPASPKELVWKELKTLSGANWRFTPETPLLRVPYAKVEGNPVWLAPERRSNREWWLIGPFPYDDHQGFYREYPPEHEFRADASYTGAFGPVKWNWTESPTYSVTPRDILHLSGSRAMGVFYAYANVYSPKEQPAQFRTAFADGMAVWWNGKEVMRVHRHPKWLLMRDQWAETKPIQMRAGWNTVLLKIEPSLMVPTAFLFRILGENGETLNGIGYSADTSKIPALEQSPAAATVDVPPAAVAWKDGKPVKGGTTVALPAGPIPEHAIEFRSGTVDFPLKSWTDSSLAFYSGAAVYETEFELSKEDAAKALAIDLGDVGVSAEVWINGHKAGERAWRPFRFDLTGKTTAGANRLKIRIANSDAGWQSQGDTIYPKGSWGLRYKTELDRLPTIRPNGLEGPVRILTRADQ
jgi:hypothetical protein